MSKSKKVCLVTMGCSKNLVDSERLYKRFENAGYKVVHDPEDIDGEIVIVNTCGFIGDAKQESIDMILECCQAKELGKVKKVFVMGCLSQRYAQELPADIPEVDGWYGKFDWAKIIQDVASKKGCDCSQVSSNDWERHLTTPKHQAYLKIAEGCNRFCAYCAIPLITGRYKSRPIDQVVDEVKHLVKEGVKEFNVIAQDLTYYGRDIYGKPQIAQLVDAIANVEGVRWIRLHYAYPTEFPMDLLDAMAAHDNVCKYLDIALQHISDRVLDNMRRHITAQETKELLAEMRRRVPGIHIRTTLMVGFPGEGEKEFAELVEFVKEQKFERMGAFAYCEEDDTYAAKHFADDIPHDVKEQRLQQLMDLQEQIALESNESKIGKVLKVIVDSENDDYYVGRTQFDSPEVDPEVLIKKSKRLKVGEMYDVVINEAMPFELIATPM